MSWRAAASSSALQPEQGGPAEQRRVDLEVRVLGGGADQDQQPALDRRQQGVLLGLVEPVDLVEEQDRALAPLPQPLVGPGHHVAHVLHAGGDRRQRLERLGGVAGDHPGEGGLAGAGRPPEDHRRQPVGLDQHPQRLAGADQVVLADDVVERAGPEPVGQRRPAGELVLDRGGEQVVSHGSRGRLGFLGVLRLLHGQQPVELGLHAGQVVGVDDPQPQAGHLAGQVVEVGLHLGAAAAVLGGLLAVPVGLAGLGEQDQRRRVGGLGGEHQVEQDELPGVEPPALGPQEFQVIQAITTMVWISRNRAVPMVWAMRSLKRPKPSGS